MRGGVAKPHESAPNRGSLGCALRHLLPAKTLTVRH